MRPQPSVQLRLIAEVVDVTHADRLVTALEECGFVAVPGAPAGTQRDLAKDGEDVSLALVGRGADGHAVVPAGPYAGERDLADIAILGAAIEADRSG